MQHATPRESMTALSAEALHFGDNRHFATTRASNPGPNLL
jgi:hypothetical protein